MALRFGGDYTPLAHHLTKVGWPTKDECEALFGSRVCFLGELKPAFFEAGWMYPENRSKRVNDDWINLEYACRFLTICPVL